MSERKMSVLRSLANRSFVATTREQAIAQFVVTAMDYRASTQITPKKSIAHNLALRAIKKAKRIRDAQDWKSVVFDERGYFRSV